MRKSALSGPVHLLGSITEIESEKGVVLMTLDIGQPEPLQARIDAKSSLLRELAGCDASIPDAFKLFLTGKQVRVAVGQTVPGSAGIAPELVVLGVHPCK